MGLRKKVGVVFIGMLIFAALNLTLLHRMLQDFNGVAATATVAGKMRMLGQKLSYDALSVSAGVDALREGIEQDIADFETAYFVLRSGGTVFGEAIRPLSPDHMETLNSLWLAWKQYRDYIRGIATAAAGQAGDIVQRQRELSDASGTLFVRTDALIQDLVREAQVTQSSALGKMYLLLFLNSIALLVAYLAVNAQFVLPLQRLARHCKELARGNYAARTRNLPNDEIGQLAGALNQSGQQIGELIKAIEHERSELRRTSAMFEGVAANAVVGVFVMDSGMRLRYVNDKLAEMFGYRPDEMAEGLTVRDLLAVPGTEAWPAGLREGARQRRRVRIRNSLHYETRAVHRDGTPLDIEVFASRMVLDGAPAIIGIVLDVTERKKAEASIRRAALVYANISEAVVVTDPAGVILDVNPAFTAITGYQAEEVIGRRMNILSSGRHDAAFYEAMWGTLRATGRWTGDIYNRRKNGEEYIEHLTIDTSYNEDGTVNCHIGLFSDVTADRLKEETIWRQAYFDHLTGLPNRKMFHEELQRSMLRADRDGRSLALVYLDLDLFKEVNDSLGHDKGDELLKEVAARLRATVRDGDVVARLGGDEFTVILNGCDDVSVDGLCRRLLSAVAEPYVLDHNVVTVSASMGVTMYPRDAVSTTDLLKHADLAMYSAKDAGRNQFRHFSLAMQREAQERRELLKELQESIRLEHFELYYQPIVEMTTGRVRKAEALLRWHHPRRGMVPPGDFIPLAEDSGLIVPIGDWVFRRAAAQTVEWRARLDAGFQVSVNVSPIQFTAEDLDPAAWIACMEEYGMPGSAVLVEITERLLMRADGASKNKLLAFRDAGVQVALDDFGTGYSSLSYLKRFDIDFIKIDQLFVRNITADSDDLALCQAIIAMAHRLGLKVVAEGVGTPAQHELLLQAGCDYAQGFLYSQPLPASKFESVLQSRLPLYQPSGHMEDAAALSREP